MKVMTQIHVRDAEHEGFVGFDRNRKIYFAIVRERNTITTHESVPIFSQENVSLSELTKALRPFAILDGYTAHVLDEERLGIQGSFGTLFAIAAESLPLCQNCGHLARHETIWIEASLGWNIHGNVCHECEDNVMTAKGRTVAVTA